MATKRAPLAPDEHHAVPLNTIALLEVAEVADAMSRIVPRARLDTPVTELEWLLGHQNVPAVVVLGPGRRLVGVVTKTDLLRARQRGEEPAAGAPALPEDEAHEHLRRALGENEDDDADEAAAIAALGFAAPPEENLGFHVDREGPLTAGQVMTREPVSASPEMSLGQALALLAFEGVSSLPVVVGRGAREEVVGLLGVGDVLQWLAERTGYLRPAARAGVRFFREWGEGDAPRVAGCAACQPRCPGC